MFRTIRGVSLKLVRSGRVWTYVVLRQLARHQVGGDNPLPAVLDQQRQLVGKVIKEAVVVLVEEAVCIRQCHHLLIRTLEAGIGEVRVVQIEVDLESAPGVEEYLQFRTVV